MDVDGFRAVFAGTALVAGDAGYDQARSLWNGDIDRRPTVIAQCSTAEQVAQALKFGRDAGLEIAVRGGGHNFAGHGCCDDGLMIDLSPMNTVTVDPVAKRARCGGGATWADYDAACQVYGLASPGGVISHTGVGGLTLGGGIGWLCAKAGLACDNLVSARMVVADGRVVTASADENPDLYWALRGGGGNFGVVTEFEFALHEVGPLVHLGLFFYGADRAAELLRFARGYVDSLPGETGVQLIGLNAPPLPFVPEEHHFALGLALIVVGFGSDEQHLAAVEPIRQELPPTFEFITPIPYAELQKMIDDSAPWGILGYEKALYLDELSDEAAGVIAEQFTRKASPMSIMPIFPLAGRYHEVDDDDTAWGGSRACKWVVNIAAIAPERDLFETDRAWVRAFYDALAPLAPSNATYVNFLAETDADDRIRASYGAAKYERLARIKAEWDPDNVLHRNANIRPLLPATP